MKPNQAIPRAKSAAKLAWRAIILIANLKPISFQLVKTVTRQGKRTLAR